MTDITEPSAPIETRPFASMAGTVLVAMPTIGDPRFHRAVIFICAHDPNGAMGLVLTQTIPGMALDQLMDQLDITYDDARMDLENTPVLSGGPVETGRGFVLHGLDFHQKETVVVNEQFAVTATVDILQAIARGAGPTQCAFMLGYAGWQAGQLEKELTENSWLTVTATPELVFDTPIDHKWETAMHLMGVNPVQLSGLSGRA